MAQYVLEAGKAPKYGTRPDWLLPGRVPLLPCWGLLSGTLSGNYSAALSIASEAVIVCSIARKYCSSVRLSGLA